jgi:hypothetical protein
MMEAWAMVGEDACPHPTDASFQPDHEVCAHPGASRGCAWLVAEVGDALKVVGDDMGWVATMVASESNDDGWCEAVVSMVWRSLQLIDILTKDKYEMVLTIGPTVSTDTPEFELLDRYSLPME